HPDLVPVAKEVFDRVLGDRPNQLDVLREDVDVSAAELLDVAATPGEITEEGLRNDVSVGIQYLAAWLRGSGAVAIFNLMEDAATSEISRSQVWQWLHHGRVSREQVQRVTDDVVGRLGDGGTTCEDAEGASGWPFFGQFVAHDITADRSPLSLRADPDGLRNFHAPRANLEPLYGDGPTSEPFLYDRDDPAKLLLGTTEDHPRNPQGLALVGDPRNDVHFFVARLHTAFARAHNRLVDRLREDGVPEPDLFEEARRATTWHYQWILLEDFLP